MSNENLFIASKDAENAHSSRLEGCTKFEIAKRGEAPLSFIYTSLSSIARIDSATLAIIEHSIRLRNTSQLNS